MAFIFALPLSLRTTLVFLLSLLVARFINWAIYKWCYWPRNFGPWAAPPKKHSPHTWQDHLPALGWFLLRREEKVHGTLFWLRPMLLELLLPIGFAWYYYFCLSGGILPAGPVAKLLQPPMHFQFLGHYLLFTLMAIATFIDFDERSIPDIITVPGTVIGILGAAFAPAWLPWDFLLAPPTEVLLSTPLVFPPSMQGTQGLTICLTILTVWAFSLLNRRWITRRGWGKAFQYFLAGIFRRREMWLPPLLVWLGLSGLLIGCHFGAIGRWPELVSACMGLAFAGGVTWAVRIAASTGLGVEALGFGDVTLMAMIGTFIGWQASLLVFFIAPMVAIVFVLIRALVTGDSSTPYGPYLCAACVLVLIYWTSLWTWARPLFALGTTVVAIVASSVVLMGVLLWIWRLIKNMLLAPALKK